MITNSEQRGAVASRELKYWAFISDSHRDARSARALHRTLETYRLPSTATTGSAPLPPRLAPVFLDREELAASADLSTSIQQALSASRSLIVVCSPAAAQSKYVDLEIAEFKRLGRTDHIFALIIDGEPGTDRECFPAQLRQLEPLAADIRQQADGPRNAHLKLIAAVSGIPFSVLKDRDQQRRLRQQMWVTSAALVIALVMGALSVVTYLARQEAEAQRKTAVAEKTAAVNAKHKESIALANETRTRQELERTVARSLLRPLGQQALERLTVPEQEAVRELWNSSDQIRELFVVEALKDPATTQQLRNRADPAIHAATGYSDARREKVVAALLPLIAKEQTLLPQRLQYIEIGLALDGAGAEFNSLAEKVVSQAIAESTDNSQLTSLGRAVNALASQLQKPQETLHFIIAALARTGNLETNMELVEAVEALASRVSPAEAVELLNLAVQTLDQALQRETNAPFVRDIAKVIELLAPRVEPKLRADQLRPLMTGMHTTAFPNNRYLADAVCACIPKLAPEQMQPAADELIQALDGPIPNTLVPSSFGRVAQALAPQLTADIAEQTLQRAAGKIRNNRNHFAPQALILVMVAMSDRIHGIGPKPRGDEDCESAAAADDKLRAAAQQRLREAFDFLLERLVDTKDERHQVYSLSLALRDLSERMPPADVARALPVVVQRLQDSQTNPQRSLDNASVTVLSYFISSRFPVNDPQAGATLSMLRTFASVEFALWNDPQREQVVALAGRLQDAELTEAVEVALVQLRRFRLESTKEPRTYPTTPHFALDLLVALAPRLSIVDATAAYLELLDCVPEVDAYYQTLLLEKPLVALVNRLAKSAAEDLYEQLLPEIKELSLDSRIVLLRTLAAVLAHLPKNHWEDEVRNRCAYFADKIEVQADPMILSYQFQVYGEYARHLDIETAELTNQRVAVAVQRAICEPKDLRQLKRLAESVEAAAPQLSDPEALQTLVAACAVGLELTTDFSTRVAFIKAINALLKRLAAKGADPAVLDQQLVIRGLRATRVYIDVVPLCQAFIQSQPENRRVDTLAVAIEEVCDSYQAGLVEALLVDWAPGDVPDGFNSSKRFRGPFGAPKSLLTEAAAARPAPPCLLSEEDLLRLMQLPTCRGDTRRVLLGILAERSRVELHDTRQLIAWIQENRPKQFPREPAATGNAANAPAFSGD